MTVGQLRQESGESVIATVTPARRRGWQSCPMLPRERRQFECNPRERRTGSVAWDAPVAPAQHHGVMTARRAGGSVTGRVCRTRRARKNLNSPRIDIVEEDSRRPRRPVSKCRTCAPHQGRPWSGAGLEGSDLTRGLCRFDCTQQFNKAVSPFEPVPKK
jgi:hypothetical protein